MGNPYRTVVHTAESTQILDFARFEIARKVARRRLEDPRVNRVEVRHGTILVFAADDSGETSIEGVITEAT